MVGSLASFLNNDTDDDFNVDFDEFDTCYNSTSMPPLSPNLPLLPSLPKSYYCPSTYNKRKLELAKAAQEKEKVGSRDTNVSIHPKRLYPTDDELTNSDFLPLKILKWTQLTPTLPSPPKFYYHPSTHNKRKSELAKV